MTRNSKLQVYNIKPFFPIYLILANLWRSSNVCALWLVASEPSFLATKFFFASIQASEYTHIHTDRQTHVEKDCALAVNEPSSEFSEKYEDVRRVLSKISAESNQ